MRNSQNSKKLKNSVLVKKTNSMSIQSEIEIDQPTQNHIAMMGSMTPIADEIDELGNILYNTYPSPLKKSIQVS